MKMKQGMNCRVCGSVDTAILPIGKYEEFFRLRVDTTKDDFLVFSRSDSIRISPAPLATRALRKIARLFRDERPKPAKQFRTHMQACTNCHAIAPCHEYSFEELLGIYSDYRSESYNRDRIGVEPSYARIANDVGRHSIEIRNRNGAVDRFLNGNKAHFRGGMMIDYGGSDGRFIPPFAYKEFESIHIFDASNAPLHASVDTVKVQKLAAPQPGVYSFLTCMHVLEHVGNPRGLASEAARLLVPGGLMYIEVPLELTESMREDFRQKVIDRPICIHEHINKFDRTSIQNLVRSIPDLEIVDDAEDGEELGWVKTITGRILARRK
jgi:hypothetical protein